MRIASVPSLLGLAIFSLVFTPRGAAAQQRAGATAVTGTAFDVTPYAGYMVFGDYLSGPLGTSVTNAPAPLVGAQLGMKIAPNISVIANLATASSDIQAGVPILGGVSIAQSRVVMYDAGLQLDLPLASMSGTELSPFLQAGVGAMRYDITESFLSTTSTNVAGNVGIGADISVGRGVGIRVMARDYIGKFDSKQATMIDLGTNTTNNYAAIAGVRFSF